MNSFFTTLKPEKQQPEITYNSKIMFLGSCFSENIGKKLEYYKFQTKSNPFGIIFHPQAIYNILNRIVTQKLFIESDLFFHNEQWHCFEVHSQLSHSNKTILLNKLNELLTESATYLKQCSNVILTYGTVWGYFHNDLNILVANCHKISQSKFSKELFSISETTLCIEKSIELLHLINPQLSIILTISPVRHVKDGIIENNLSKSHLLASTHFAIKKKSFVHYYPAYELMMDSLRDYRFYKADLLHPNEIAIDFIWEHFQNTWIHKKETQEALKQIQEIQQGLAHKPFNAKSKAHQKFKASLNEKINNMCSNYPFMNF